MAAVLIGAAGYWVRFLAPIAPELRDHLGAVAYVIFWTIILACLAPRIKPWRGALIILLIACTLEFTQLWHPVWLERMRRTFLGRVILGTTFDWSDFYSYIVGAALGWVLLFLLQSGLRRSSQLH